MITAARPIGIPRKTLEAACRSSLAPDGFVLTLLILGMIAGLVAVMSFQKSFEIQSVANPAFFSIEIEKTPLYYGAHTIQLFFALSAGMAAMISLDFRTIDRTYLARFSFLIGAALLMTARGYTWADLHSSRLVDATGPVPFVFFTLVFVGARRSNWRILEKVFALESIVLCCLVVIGFTKLRMFTRDEAVIALGAYLNILLWPAAWMLLASHDQNSWLRRLRFGPILIYAVGSVLVQTRLNFVMIFALLLVHAYIQRRRGVSQLASWIVWGSLALWLCLFTAIFLRDTHAFEKFDGAAEAFYSRLDEDTRTGQLYSFFQDVQLHELLLGRGSFATWKWGSLLWKGGTDVGYLSLLLYGGLPLLIAYVGAQVAPSLKLFRRDMEDWQLPAAGVVFLFAIRMFSSSYPGENLESYALLVCTGACIPTRRVLPSLAPRRA